jgi:prolyl-tRNA synthetase
MQFPVIIPEDSFQKEEQHIEGFSTEVFWITRAGENELERKLLLRPTSETAIYPMLKIWIRSHQDLPFLMHQTCNVYRYETKATRPLYRGREFLWNEAHTAHKDYEESEKQVREAMRIYSMVFDRLALSYLMLKRPDFDKFAGAVYSVAFDTWNPDGKVNQIGTVHQLGDNFAKAFELTFENEKGNQAFCSTTCYGMGFGRTIAAIMAHHGDENGLILPPDIAPKQIVIIPIYFRDKMELVKDYAKNVETLLKEAGVRVVFDSDDRKSPGEKFYKWEMFGVPIRIEIGPREAGDGTVTLVRRDTFDKESVKLDDLLPYLDITFQMIFENLREKSNKKMKENLVDANSMKELEKSMDERKIVRIKWCGDSECANNLKDLVAGEIRGTLWDYEEEITGKCTLCGNDARYLAFISRTY